MLRLVGVIFSLACCAFAQALPAPAYDLPSNDACGCRCACCGACGSDACVLPSAGSATAATAEAEPAAVVRHGARVASRAAHASIFSLAKAVTPRRDALVAPSHPVAAARVPLFQEHCCLRL